MTAKSPSPALVLALGVFLLAAPPTPAAPAVDAPAQEMLEFPVRVVDPDGKPVAGAVVIPWALRSSQGHGRWHAESIGVSGPPRFETDADGRAMVHFPRYNNLAERVLTTQVTLSIDHGKFAYADYEFVDIPRKETGDYVVTLKPGAAIKIQPRENGQPASLDGLQAMWSDGRSWKPEVKPTPTADGGIIIPPMPLAPGMLMLARLDGERATHISSVVEVNPTTSETISIEVELTPARRLTGTLSADVPRPVRNGRVLAHTLPRANEGEYVYWATWARVAEDGTFVIDAWPAGEAIQMIGLCEGFYATSGVAPQEAESASTTLAERGYNDAIVALRALVHRVGRAAEASPENTSLSLASLAAKAATERVRPSFFQRPQVFRPEVFDQPLVLDMDAAERCDVLTVDEHGRPIADVKIYAGKNVGWWNIGSNIYGRPLFRSERILLTRDFTQCDETDACPKSLYAVTDKDGHASLDLVLGPDSLGTDRDDYELPIDQGRRDERVMVLAGETTHVALIMQPKGTEHLGEWDKLAGVLFGCTGEQCRRLLEDQGFRKSMEAVRAEFDAAKNPRDPKMLMKAYAKMAEAFKEVDDEEEVARWKQKAAEQAEKAGAEAPAEPSRN
jgi:hypothetical protein